MVLKAGFSKRVSESNSCRKMVKRIEVGDTVFINPKRYAVMEHKKGLFRRMGYLKISSSGFKFDIIDIDGVSYAHSI